MRYILVLFLFLQSFAFAENSNTNRLLICGVCRNVSGALDATIKNIEELGCQFVDYRVIIYENNSNDDTASKLREWANNNPNVVFITEKLSAKQLNKSRTTRIADARNKVLREVRKKKYDKYKYLVMADLDFKQQWPVQEIINSVNHSIDWDCISANGITDNGLYYDRFAYRSFNYPFGPELLGVEFWHELPGNMIPNTGSWFSIQPNGWPKVFSAFGGLAIYKTATIKKFSYSGTVTKKLKKYYKKILQSLPRDNTHLIKYEKANPKKQNKVIFCKNCMEWQSPKDPSIAVCEHVTLHAAMANKGHDVFYINPKLVMRY